VSLAGHEVARRFLFGVTMAIKVNVNKNVLIGAAAVLFGLLIALGPQFLFKACPMHDGEWSQCHWSVQAELATGIIIAVLGACIIFLSDLKTHVGLTIGIFLAGIVTVAIPYSIIRGCEGADMTCQKITFPILAVLGGLVMAGAIVYIVYIGKKVKI